jgi:putative ABC transport system permease protein
MMSDFRYAVRAFARTPGFTTVAVLTLALGIGATTAIFSVVYAVLLKPLPYAAADRLVVLRLSLPDFRDVQRTARSFDGMAAWASNLYNLRTDAGAQQVAGGVVSLDLLPLLGVEPVLGRTFTAEDYRQETVILGYGLWQSRYGGDPSVLGRAIELSGSSYTVIGVAPAWFGFPSGEFQLWTPMGTIEAKAPQQAGNRALRIFSAVARMKPGVTIEQARSELAILGTELERVHPDTNKDVRIEPVPLYDRVIGDARSALLLVLGTVALLLLIACTNVANLMLARATVREREMAIRTALGAGRARLVRQLATESLVLAAAGGALGLIVTMWGVDGLPALLEGRMPRAEGIGVSGAVLLFALGATILTALLFGVAPALYTAGRGSTALKDGGRAIAGTVRGRLMRRTIVVAEIALAVVVVVGAGLLVRSFAALTAQDPGFQPGALLSFNVQFLKQPDGAARAQAAAGMLERLTALPGVAAVGASTGLPVVTPQRGTRFEIDGRTLTSDEDGAHLIAATAGYFQAIGTPILAGRGFEAADRAGAQPVAVVNRTLAERLFPGQDPLGQRLRVLNPEHSSEWRTIVGVAGDVQYRELNAEVPPAIYTPFAQTPFLWLYVMVRPAGDGPSLVRAIPAAVAADPALAAANLRPMREIVSDAVAEPRFHMLLLSGFAALALVLAGVGIYGVLAYAVTERTQEIGIRLALGATPAAVTSMVLREGALIACGGVALGLAGSALLTRTMRTLLFGVSADDPLTFGAGGTVLLLVALAASYLPARRAVRVNPVSALRAE